MELARKLDAGTFVVLAEMEPPKGADASAMVGAATKVKGAVDAFLVPEMSNAVMRMSSLSGAMLLQAKGMDAIMQVNCRDRNRLALQADLLGASACGVGGVMAVSGEEPSFGDHHEARPVYDIQLLELLGAIRSLQSGRDMAGVELAGAPQFLVGAAVNSGAPAHELDREVVEMRKKVEAGARFFVTPPVFDLNVLEAFRQRVRELDVHLIPTVLLLKSLGMARYLQRHMASVAVPGALIQRLQKAPDKVRECVRVAAETVIALREARYSGVLISTLGWEHKLPEILGGMGV
ncbi:MAG: methylenetetrahydrofolate reductase [Desulfobacterales bacterium]|jgi:5,10-methylenetetrahydrofolate reductase|nr:methylenetetrahydrofolate reductase [Desulfobacterales bacterium]MDZ7596997.1 methylenetetrahydrofolate reductase [Desulfobacterales bacterium]